MRRQQDHRAALRGQFIDAFGAALRDHVLDGVGRAVPQHATVDDGLRQRPEVLAHPAFAHGFGLIREAQFEIAAHDAGA